MEKLDFIDSKFRLAILAAKRGKQILGGAKKKIDSHAENPLTIAIEEIYQGKIDLEILTEDAHEIDKEKAPGLLTEKESSGVEDFLYSRDENSSEEEAV